MKTTGFGFLKTQANFGITRKMLLLTIVENVSYFLSGRSRPISSQSDTISSLLMGGEPLVFHRWNMAIL